MTDPETQPAQQDTGEEEKKRWLPPKWQEPSGGSTSSLAMASSTGTTTRRMCFFTRLLSSRTTPKNAVRSVADGEVRSSHSIAFVMFFMGKLAGGGVWCCWWKGKHWWKGKWGFQCVWPGRGSNEEVALDWWPQERRLPQLRSVLIQPHGLL